MLLAGYLFAFALIGPDPAPHRPGLVVRAGVLVAAVAAHDVLAKLLYATPPPGVPVAQAEAAGLLMYYGAAPVHVALFVLLGREWFAGQRRAARGGLLSQEPRTAQRGAATASSAALHVENASHSPGAAARISAGEGWPSTPPRTTPASRASRRPAATSQSLVPARTAQSKPAAGEVGEVQRGGDAADVADLGQQCSDDVDHQLLRRGGRVEAEAGESPCPEPVRSEAVTAAPSRNAPSPEIALNVSPTTGSCTTARARSSSPGRPAARCTPTRGLLPTGSCGCRRAGRRSSAARWYRSHRRPPHRARRRPGRRRAGRRRSGPRWPGRRARRGRWRGP